MSIVRIAEAANVSYATAWRIINKRPGSSPQAVTAVQRAIGELGFTPNTPGVGKRGRKAKVVDGIRTHNIALLHLRVATSISSTLLSHVQRLLDERNLNLIFAHMDGMEGLPQAVRSGNVDGILGYGQFPAEAITPRLREIPAVWLMSRADDLSDGWGDRVKPDHARIGHLAAEYLLGKGHHVVAYMNPDVKLPIYQERCAAFRLACEAKGVEAIRIENPTSGADIDEEAERLFQQWLGTSPRPTGLFVPVDRVTLSVYRQLERHGIQPGKDVEIVSCDNETPIRSLMRPAPASIDLNRQAIAQLAVDRLLWRMKHGASFPSVVSTVAPTLTEAS